MKNPIPPTMLSVEQVEAFFEIGFVIVPDVFTPTEIGEMRAGFDRLQEMAYALSEAGIYKGSDFAIDRLESGRVIIHRISWCGAAEPVLLAYGKDHRLLGMASQLLGSNEMNQLINQAHFKIPGDNVAFPWHQDSEHRGYGKPWWKDVNGRGSFVQQAIAIDDVTKRNGPLKFIPGSCKWGHLGLLRRSEEECRAIFNPDDAITGIMKAGSVALFNPYIIHGSEPNRSQKPRRVFINGYAYPGANSRTYPGRGAGRLLKITEDTT